MIYEHKISKSTNHSIDYWKILKYRFLLILYNMDIII